MLILKRFITWVLEISCQAPLFGVLLFMTGLFFTTGGPRIYVHELLLGLAIAIGVMWDSGYVVTTALVGVIWRSQRLWVYPTIASILFILHFQYWTFLAGNGWSLGMKLFFQAGGVCLVFGCTFTGNFLLRRWVQADRRPRPTTAT